MPAATVASEWGIARYEASVRTSLCFWTSGVRETVGGDTVKIRFDGRAFVWHAAREHEGEWLCPVVTVMAENGDNYAEEGFITNRLLSALCFILDYPMSIATTAATGYRAEHDRPILAQPGLPPTTVYPSITEIAVDKDDRLRLVVALHREGRSANSSLYQFLAFYNALDAAFDSRGSTRDHFIRSALTSEPIPPGKRAQQFDWADYLRDELRNAVAHAVRRPGKPVLDPDGLTDLGALDEASRTVSRLVRRRVEDRWPGGVRATFE